MLLFFVTKLRVQTEETLWSKLNYDRSYVGVLPGAPETV